MKSSPTAVTLSSSNRAAWRIPHTLAVLFFLMALALVSTWILPQGRFETTTNERGRSVVVPGTYQVADERVLLMPWDLVTVVPQAMSDAQGIIFFLLIVGGAIRVLQATEAPDAGLAWVLQRLGNRPFCFILVAMALFAAASATLGCATEYIPLTTLLVSLCAALRLDAVAACGIMVGGYCIGYGAALLNPYTIIVAQEVSGLRPTSGLAFRLAMFGPFVAVGVHHVWRYAQRTTLGTNGSEGKNLSSGWLVQSPSKPLRVRDIAIVGMVLGALLAMVWGIPARGWYLTELTAIWLALAIACGWVGRLGVDGTARRFAEGASELASVALMVGFARSIALLLERGQVLHTIVYGLSRPLEELPPIVGALGMLCIQTVINFFIPSGSGQAYATMPIMAPLSDVIGVERQVAVLAFQFGDGFSNVLIPTNIVLMAILGMAGVSYDRWVRFAGPLLIKLTALAAGVLLVAVVTGYK
ncbi:MAG: TIGR00366 family protein [Verrucomicrobiota bacterium]|nr:TIGR00366 family protein [Limisphaera sp.]MDW8382777.1 TIGR00366 family protein [Verrucomicrobiota bacterium]